MSKSESNHSNSAKVMPSKTSSPIHRGDDGEPLAVVITLGPDEIATCDLPLGTRFVQPVVRNGMVHIEPADC